MDRKTNTEELRGALDDFFALRMSRDIMGLLKPLEEAGLGWKTAPRISALADVHDLVLEIVQRSPSLYLSSTMLRDAILRCHGQAPILQYNTNAFFNDFMAANHVGTVIRQLLQKYRHLKFEEGRGELEEKFVKVAACVMIIMIIAFSSRCLRHAIIQSVPIYVLAT